MMVSGMLKKGDHVMFIVGRTSKIFEVETDPFTVESDKLVVVLKGYRGLINVNSLVKVQNMFEESEGVESPQPEKEQEEIITERYVLNDDDKMILAEVKSHLREGIEKLKKRGVRSVNIELEITQFMLHLLRKG